MNDETKQPNFPYVSYPTFKAFIAHLRNTVVTGQIDNTMMPATLSGSARGSVMSALKTLKLIDELSKTTQGLKDLVDAYETKDWPAVLKKYVLPTYSQITDNLNLKTASRKQIDDVFGDISLQMKEKCIRFFLSVNKEAGIEYSPHLKIRRRLPKKRIAGTTPKGAAGGNDLPPELPKNETPPNMFDLPLLITSDNNCYIRIPRDITIKQAAKVKAAADYIAELAKQNEGSKE